jgi:hypothetical protein
MFIRWQKRLRGPRSGKTDVHWGAVLIEAVRVDGKPRQRYVAYLGGLTEQGIEDVRQRCRFWDRANARLHALSHRLTDQDRNRIVAKLATRVPIPTRHEHAQSQEPPVSWDVTQVRRRHRN